MFSTANFLLEKGLGGVLVVLGIFIYLVSGGETVNMAIGLGLVVLGVAWYTWRSRQ